eukprot:3880744-Prymnesium_polylepis.1
MAGQSRPVRPSSRSRPSGSPPAAAVGTSPASSGSSAGGRRGTNCASSCKSRTRTARSGSPHRMPAATRPARCSPRTAALAGRQTG